MEVTAALREVRRPTQAMVVRSELGVSIKSSQGNKRKGEKGVVELRWWSAMASTASTPAAMAIRGGEEEEMAPTLTHRLSGEVDEL